MARTVYLSLGSNLGDPERNLRAALDRLRREIEVERVSSVYETEPYGVTEQPPFLNIAVTARTELAPAKLLEFVKRVEREVGRRPTYRWGPRVVDVDILLIDDEVVASPALTLPHADMHRRAFVLVPLAEIAADIRHPVLGKTVREMLEDLGDVGGVHKVEG